MIKKVTTLANLAQLVSMEFIISAFVAMFVLGGVWISITAGIAVAQATANESVQKAVQVERSVSEIRTDIAVVKANQANLAQATDDLSDEVSEQRKDIKKILSILGNGDHRHTGE